jgi:hypothetical protein
VTGDFNQDQPTSWRERHFGDEVSVLPTRLSSPKSSLHVNVIEVWMLGQ